MAPVMTSDSACGSSVPARSDIVLSLSALRRYGAFETALPNSCASPASNWAVVKVAVAFFQDDFAKRIVSERHEDGGEVAEKLVKCGGLRADRLVKVRPQAIEHGVAELVVYDVGSRGR